MVPVLAEWNLFKTAWNDAGYFSVQTFSLLVFIQLGNECCATVTGKSARLHDVPENFFREEIARQGVIDVDPAPEAHGVSGVHAALADQVTVVAKPYRSSGRDKEAGLAPKILDQISVQNRFVFLDLS